MYDDGCNCAASALATSLRTLTRLILMYQGDWGEYHLGLGGYCDDLDPPFGYWCAMKPPRGQESMHTCTLVHLRTQYT